MRDAFRVLNPTLHLRFHSTRFFTKSSSRSAHLAWKYQNVHKLHTTSGRNNTSIIANLRSPPSSPSSSWSRSWARSWSWKQSTLNKFPSKAGKGNSSHTDLGASGSTYNPNSRCGLTSVVKAFYSSSSSPPSPGSRDQGDDNSKDDVYGGIRQRDRNRTWRERARDARKRKGSLTSASSSYSANSSDDNRSDQRRDSRARQESHQEPEKEKEPHSMLSSSNFGRAGMIGSTLVLLSGKAKWLISALKLTKMSSLLSMLASVGAYSMIFGVPFAAGFVGLIVVHESGHALAMRYYGIPYGPMVFIPFMGAAVEMKKHPASVDVEAMVAFAGPVLGSAGALLTGVAGHALDSQLLIALADAGLMINAFNMLPIGSMDGGRIAQAVSPYALVGGLGLGGLLLYHGVVKSPVFYLIMMMAAFQTYEQFSGAHPRHPSYYNISAGKKFGIAASYVGLIAAILAAMAWNNSKRKSPQQVRRDMVQSGDKGLVGREESVFERFSQEWGDDDMAANGSRHGEFKDPWAPPPSSSPPSPLR